MLKKILAAVFTIVVLVSTSGCATVTPAQVHAAKGTGMVRVYAASREALWKAIPEVLTELNLKYVGEDKQAGYILAQSDLAVAGRGEIIAIFVETPGGVENTRVEVISKKAKAANIFSHSRKRWEDEILNKLDEKFRSSGSSG